MSGPSRLKGEKYQGGLAHCFVNIFVVVRQTEGDKKKEREESTFYGGD